MAVLPKPVTADWVCLTVDEFLLRPASRPVREVRRVVTAREPSRIDLFKVEVNEFADREVEVNPLPRFPRDELTLLMALVEFLAPRSMFLKEPVACLDAESPAFPTSLKDLLSFPTSFEARSTALSTISTLTFMNLTRT